MTLSLGNIQPKALFSSFQASEPISPLLLSSVLNSARRKQVNSSRVCWRCNTISKPHAQVYTEVVQKGIPLIKWREIIQDDDEGEGYLEFSELDQVTNLVETSKAILGSMNDGEISISAYDTAWVALVKDIDGTNAPQFPSSLQWIVENQLPDGSWGDKFIFSAHDRLLSTLACVIALKTWNIYQNKCDQGMYFIRENMSKLEDENIEHMPIGFEVSFPSLLEIARNLRLDVPEGSPFLQDIYTQRDLKLTRIPKDMMHIMPTTLLHSLEGMGGLDWEKLLKLQCSDGSFLFSPASTAFALMQTKDEKCLGYLKNIVERFNGGVPNVYPVDMFEHLWAVDRLERLGISRYFTSEIKECLDYVYRYWTEDGICWARNTKVYDIDDTAMGFRLLRLHGHQVSPDVFRHFKKGDEFFCFVGQSNQAITGMFNLHRASQVVFPGENILEEAKKFSYKFLREKQALNQLLDKWIITKDLPGEVGYSLDIPWYASLPRIEARFFIEQYGGEDDVWIGKTLYRMPIVNNNIYLDLAKLDFNNCQALHLTEWVSIQKWYTDFNLGDYGVSRRTLLHAYFVAMSSIFEQGRSRERLAWTQTVVLVKAISYYFEEASDEERSAFIQDFVQGSSAKSINKINGRWWMPTDNNTKAKKTRKRLLETLNTLIDAAKGNNNLSNSWKTWMLIWNTNRGEDNVVELLVRTIASFASGMLDDNEEYDEEETLSHPQYKKLVDLTNNIYQDLTNNIYQKLRRIRILHEATGREINGASEVGVIMQKVESDMQELVQTVLQKSDGVNSEFKQMFLTVAKSLFYTAYCSPETIDLHIAKVLFERVI